MSVLHLARSRSGNRHWIVYDSQRSLEVRNDFVSKSCLNDLTSRRSQCKVQVYQKWSMGVSIVVQGMHAGAIVVSCPLANFEHASSSTRRWCLFLSWLCAVVEQLPWETNQLCLVVARRGSTIATFATPITANIYWNMSDAIPASGSILLKLGGCSTSCITTCAWRWPFCWLIALCSSWSVKGAQSLCGHCRTMVTYSSQSAWTRCHIAARMLAVLSFRRLGQFVTIRVRSRFSFANKVMHDEDQWIGDISRNC